MSKNRNGIELDEDGFRVCDGHGEVDLSFLDSRLDNAHEDASFEISPEYFAALRRSDVEDFESLVDGAQS